ncbi:Probable LRR receptor-like serine/threonine-protein kinase RKF3, partial [Linum perenne]
FLHLRHLVATANLPSAIERPQACQYILQGLRLLQSDRLLRTNTFLLSLSTVDSCWRSYQRFVDDFIPNFDIRYSRGFRTSCTSLVLPSVTSPPSPHARIILLFTLPRLSNSQGLPISASSTISSPTSTSATPAASARAVLHWSFHRRILECN